MMSRWKILDNLRRSLMAPATVALLFLGWTVLPGRRSCGRRSAWRRSCCRWSCGWGNRSRPSRSGIWRGLSSNRQRRFQCRRGPRRAAPSVPGEPGLRDGGRDRRDAGSSDYHEGRLLEWETAAATANRAGPPRVSVFVREMIASPLVAVIGLIVMTLVAAAGVAGIGADPRAVGRGTDDCLRAEPAGAHPSSRAGRRGPGVSQVGGAQDVADTSRRSSDPRITRCRRTTSSWSRR